MDDIRILNDNFMNGCGCRNDWDCGCERCEERCERRDRSCECERNEDKCCRREETNVNGVFEYIEAIKDLKGALCELKEGQRFFCESLKEYEEGICKQKKGIEVIKAGEKLVCDAIKGLEEGLCGIMKHSMY